MAAMAEHERELINAGTGSGFAEVNREIADKGFQINKTGRICIELGNPRWTESLQKARGAHRSAAQIGGVLDSPGASERGQKLAPSPGLST